MLSPWLPAFVETMDSGCRAGNDGPLEQKLEKRRAKRATWFGTQSSLLTLYHGFHVQLLVEDYLIVHDVPDN